MLLQNIFKPLQVALFNEFAGGNHMGKCCCLNTCGKLLVAKRKIKHNRYFSGTMQGKKADNTGQTVRQQQADFIGLAKSFFVGNAKHISFA